MGEGIARRNGTLTLSLSPFLPVPIVMVLAITIANAIAVTIVLANAIAIIRANTITPVAIAACGRSSRNRSQKQSCRQQNQRGGHQEQPLFHFSALTS